MIRHWNRERFQQYQPPAVRDEIVFRTWDYLVFTFLSVLSLGFILWLLRYWFGVARADSGSVVVWLFTFQLLYWLATQQGRWWLLPCMKRPRQMPPRAGWRVGVATTFVPHLESLEMLEQTVSALVAMGYPHDTWVLDEGNDERVKAMCVRLGAHHFTRKTREQYQAAHGEFASCTKHGNYNAWFAEIAYERYDIITGFDPDHVPEPYFLNKVVGFFEDPAVGYVQAPQVYYNQNASFIARGAAEETYTYYSTTQMASYSMSFPIVTGCHHSHRVTALRQVGGFPAHDADDLLITLLYRARGWQGVYLPEVLARGITPVDWAGYLSQQLRWVQSVLDVKLRAFPRLAGKLPLRTRISSALHGIFYVDEGLSGLVGIGLLSFMLVSGWTPGFLSMQTLAHILLTFLVLHLANLYRQRFLLQPRSESGVHWRAALLRAAKWPYTLLGIFYAVVDRKRPYALTAKVKQRAKRMLLIPHLTIIGVLGAAWISGALLGRNHHPLLLAPVVFTLLTSLVLIWTESWAYPDPFAPRLLADEPERRRLHVAPQQASPQRAASPSRYV